jgi:3-hydroxybutyryl-CoA dehydrogenase
MHLAIIGTGKMGTTLFQWAVERDVEITLCSRSEENLQQQEARFLRKLDRMARRGGAAAEQAANRKSTVHFTTKMSDLGGVDFALESVPENIETKTPVLRAMEEAVGPDALVLSNTSFISLARLAKALKRPERFCGLHFFNPIMVIPIVEIIAWKGVAPGVTDRLLALCDVLQRPGIVVADGPGSPINAILATLYVEALYLLEEGAVLPLKLDEIARRYFSPGPSEAIDTLGIEFILQGLGMFTLGDDGRMTDWLRTDTRELTPDEAGGRVGFHVPWLFSRLHAEKRHGRKANRGVCIYEGDKTLNDAPEFYLRPGNPPRPLSDDEIAARLFYTVLNSALYAVSRGFCSPADLDRGLKEVLLMQQGPFSTARAMGVERVRREFAELDSRYGRRFHPLLDLEKAGIT